MNEVVKAVETLHNFFKNPENFRTTSGKLEGVLISNWMDAISHEFFKEYIEPEAQQMKGQILDIGAKA